MKRIIIAAALSIAIITGFSVAVLATPDSQSRPQTYVALGDSVAAGAGLSSANEASLCDRSSQAYPHLVAQQLGISVQSYACSGAKTDEGIYDEQEIGDTAVPAQLDEAFSQGTPDLMTITIGANDARWVSFIRQCYFLRCGYEVDTIRSAVYLADLRLELNVVMAKIHHRSDGNPPLVLMNGYYNPFDNGNCAALESITAKERTWLDERVAELNEAIRETAARYSYAHFVPIDFRGHGLCSSPSWVQGRSDPAPFHPTVEGEQAIARQNIAVYNQVAASGPQASPSSLRERFLDWWDMSVN